MPLDLRVGGALILLFGLLASRVMQLTKNDVIDDGEVTYLDIDSHRLMLPPRLARLVRQSRDQRLALAAELPASFLADLAGSSRALLPSKPAKHAKWSYD